MITIADIAMAKAYRFTASSSVKQRLPSPSTSKAEFSGTGLLEGAASSQMSRVSRCRCRHRRFHQPAGLQDASTLRINGLMRKLHGHSKHDNDHEQRPALTTADHDSSVWGNTRAGGPAARVC
jgi:hypothetical protein